MIDDLKAIREKIREELATDYGKRDAQFEAGRHFALNCLLQWIDGWANEKSQIQRIDLSGPFGGNWEMVYLRKLNEVIDAVNELRNASNRG